MKDGLATSELWAGVGTGVAALATALASEDRDIKLAAIAGTCLMVCVYTICRTIIKRST